MAIDLLWCEVVRGGAMAMSGLQRFFTRLVPRSWAASMEADSRRWMMRCESCRYEQSIWDLGGIRWKATGTSATARKCPSCGKRGRHTVYFKQEAGG